MIALALAAHNTRTTLAVAAHNTRNTLAVAAHNTLNTAALTTDNTRNTAALTAHNTRNTAAHILLISRQLASIRGRNPIRAHPPLISSLTPALRGATITSHARFASMNRRFICVGLSIRGEL